MSWVLVVITGLIALSITRAVGRTFSPGSRTRDVWRAWRPWMIPAAVGMIGGVVLIGVPLYGLGGIWSWSWWGYLNHGSPGNPFLGQTSDDAHGFAGAWLQVMAVAIPVSLLLVVPVFALEEELDFRRGLERKTRAAQIRSAVIFGLMHCIAGIPLAFGIALIFSGLCFNAAYLRADRQWRTWRRLPEHVSAALHMTYNYLVIIALLASLWATH